MAWDFSHNDYLGLSQHAAMAQVVVEAAQRYGTGNNSSPLVSGYTVLHQQLEAAVCQWTNSSCALTAASGYQLNQTVLNALGQVEDVLFIMDKLAHASLVDGVLASNARWKRFRHNDVRHLTQLLRQHRASHPHTPVWVVTESLFSMDGDLAPLNDLVAVCQAYDAFIYLDEAHACGLYGLARFSGLAEATGAETAITLRMGTFSKALGSYGAWLVMQDTMWRDYLVNTARGFIYSTSLPPTVLAANLKAVELVQIEPHHRGALINRIRQFRQCDTPLTPEACETGSPIVPVPYPDNGSCLAAAEAFQAKGFWVKAIRPPTVPTPRLRLTLSALHSEQALLALKQGL